MPRQTLIAGLASFALGIFIFLQAVEPTATHGWTLCFLAIFFAALGLTVIFPDARGIVIVSLALSPFFAVALRFAIQIVHDPTCCNLTPPLMVVLLFVGWPMPLLGWSASLLLRRIPFAHAIATGLLATTVLSAFLFSQIRDWQLTRDWHAASRLCLTDGARPHELYLDVCSDHDQYDAVLACQNQFRPPAPNWYAIRRAGRESVNNFMNPLKPSSCR